MSTSLYWSIDPPEPKETSIDYLKRTLAKRLGDSDGSLTEDLGVVGKELIPFLEGIVEGNNSDMGRDAQELIDAINKHENVRLIIHS